jgi:WD40 repeat protein
LWSASTGFPLVDPLPHGDRVGSASYNPAGDHLVTACDDGNVRIWHLVAGEPDHWLKHDATVLCVDVSRDGQRAVTGSVDGTARLWTVAGGVEVGPAWPHGDAVTACSFAPDGRLVATGSESGVTRAWTPDGRLSWSVPATPSRIVQLGFSSNGLRGVSSQVDGRVQVWDAHTGKVLARVQLTPGVAHAALSPNGQILGTASIDHTARLWDAVTGAPLRAPWQHGDEVAYCCFSPDGTLFLTASFDKTARLFRVADGQELPFEYRELASVLKAVFSPDGQRVATACSDGTCHVWSVMDGRPRLRLNQEESITDVAFSGDGSRLVTCSEDQTAQVWDGQSGQPLSPPLRHPAAVRSLALAPDARHLVTLCGNNAAHVWSLMADEDAPSALLALEARLWTGFSLSKDGTLALIPPDLFAAEMKKCVAMATEHARSCKFPEANLWRLERGR